jgi:serine/threonine protein kinase
MSPEQCGAEDLTAATDQYSLAVMAYEALTGRVPFTAATPVAVLMAQMQNALPPPRSINPDLSDEIAAVLLKGLAKDPADRYKTCHQLIRALAVAGDAPLPTAVLEPGSRSTPATSPLTPPPGPMPTQPQVVAPPTPTPPPAAPAPVTPPPQAAQPPPYYTPPPQQQPYYQQPQPYQPPQPAYQPQRPAYQPQQSWQQRLPKTGSTGLVITVAISLALAVFTALIFFIAAIGTPDDPSTQTAEVWIGVGGLFYSALLLFTLIGVVRKATWGLVLSWVSAVALCLSCVGLVAGVPLGIFAARTRF